MCAAATTAFMSGRCLFGGAAAYSSGDDLSCVKSSCCWGWGWGRGRGRRYLSQALPNPDRNPRNKIHPQNQIQIQKQEQKQKVPCLMLSSPTKPESRYLYDVLTRGAQDGDDRMPLLAFNREIDLPQIAGHNCVGSSQGFLITVDHSAGIHATNPITGAHLPLPSTANLPNMIGVVRDAATRDIRHYVVSKPPLPFEKYRTGKRRTGKRQVRPFSRFFYEDRRRKDSRLIHELKPGFDGLNLEYMRFTCYGQAVISPGLDFVAVTQRRGGLRGGLAAFARLGQDTSWTALPAPHESVHDVTFRDGCLYTIDIHGTLAAFDLDNPSSPLFRSPDGPLGINYEWRPRFLVGSPEGDDLFLLEREIGFCRSKTTLRTKTFTVYKLDWSNLLWSRVTSIADYALFVGTNDSMALSARDFPCIKPDSIYFTDYFYTSPGLNSDAGVFNLKDGSIRPLSYNFSKFNWPRPLWFTPGMP